MDIIWQKSLSIIKTHINEQVFTAWFLCISPASMDEDSITLGVPNKFFENWIREKHMALILSSVKESAGKPLKVKFKIVEIPQALSPQNFLEQPDSSHISTMKEKEGAVGWLKSVFSSTRQVPESRYQEIGLNPQYTFDNFVIGQSNRFAHAASLAVCENLSKVYNPLFLYGGVGLGKTHLMHAIGHESLKKYPRAKILYISSEEFTNQLIHAIRTRTTQKFRSMYRNVDVLLIDDIQFIAGKDSTQEEFFHTFNSLHDSHKQIVLCSDRSPQKINGLEERLVSRFAWGLIADIQLPDFETRMAILEKKSENAAVKVTNEVLCFLAEHIKTNIREMEGALIRVVAYSKLTGQAMSPGLAREVLGEMISAEKKRITISNIQKTVADFHGINESDMKTKKRTRALAYPRQIAMYLARDLTPHSLPDIGTFFGGRDHTTVLHACDKIETEMKNKKETLAVVKNLTSLLKNGK
ncbi:MAG: chromosomal replication initiator protein DnaA [Candidatus Omnitrophota bacterium]